MALMLLLRKLQVEELSMDIFQEKKFTDCLYKFPDVFIYFQAYLIKKGFKKFKEIEKTEMDKDEKMEELSEWSAKMKDSLNSI